MAKKFIFRGKEWDEISKMSIDEYAKLVTARERRTLKRGLTVVQKKLLEKIKEKPKKFHKTHSRDMLILPEMVGVKIGIFDGRKYESVEIKPEMINHRLGEFILTRKQVKHSSPGFGATKSSKFVPLK
ncbi:MAG: 30S ribosomal protein S19 [Candidatus Micrarchaeota archaeon]|nr:30S ribosomal protein S19 [Candidatus Micrarchaeota archaeon]